MRVRLLRRLWTFTLEVSILTAGFVVSTIIGALAGDLFGPESIWPPLTFCAGLVVTVLAILRFRRISQPWKIEYDAANYIIGKTQRHLHPNWAKAKRIVGRTALWLPSAIAAMVLVFLPVMTHLANLRSHYVRHYRVPIPWTSSVFSLSGPTGDDFVEVLTNSTGNGRFGISAFWNREPGFSSHISFFRSQAGEIVDYTDEPTWLKRSGATQVVRKEFRLGTIPLTCWQFMPPMHVRGYRRFGPEPTREVTCSTPADLPERSFRARFRGQEGDIAIFDKILRGVTPVD
jgi:hypothetical protein